MDSREFEQPILQSRRTQLDRRRLDPRELESNCLNGFRIRPARAVLAADINHLRGHKHNEGYFGKYTQEIPLPFDAETAETLWFKIQEEYQNRKPQTPFEILAAKEDAVIYAEKYTTFMIATALTKGKYFMAWSVEIPLDSD